MMFKFVDLHSDSVAKPIESMRAAIAAAEVGDHVLTHDPTAFRLETEIAKIMGKETALFVPSGTMGNLISVLVNCEIRGSEVIVWDDSHIHIYENGGILTMGGAHPRTVRNNPDRTMDVGLIEAAIRDPRGELMYPRTRLICLENPQANCRGRCLSVEYTDKVGELVKRHGIVSLNTAPSSSTRSGATGTPSPVPEVPKADPVTRYVQRGRPSSALGKSGYIPKGGAGFAVQGEGQ